MKFGTCFQGPALTGPGISNHRFTDFFGTEIIAARPWKVCRSTAWTPALTADPRLPFNLCNL
jgi:hypothetical protein